MLNEVQPQVCQEFLLTSLLSAHPVEPTQAAAALKVYPQLFKVMAVVLKPSVPLPAQPASPDTASAGSQLSSSHASKSKDKSKPSASTLTLSGHSVPVTVHKVIRKIPP